MDSKVKRIGQEKTSRALRKSLHLIKSKIKNKYRLQNTNIYFPFELYQTQKNYISKLLSNRPNRLKIEAIKEKSHGLLESPTGTGKTLCILSACLSAMHSDPSISRVVYLSRTHNQLNQAVKELELLPFKAKVATLASRMIYCKIPQFRNFGNEICSAM